MRFSYLAVSGCAIAAAVCVACGSDSGGSGSGSGTVGGPSGTTVPTITILGQNGTQAFSPNPAMFGGQTVVFKNNDGVTHRVLLNDGSADTGDIAPGATSRQVAIPNSGTNYHCSIHAGMIGSVAAASGGTAPPCEGPYCSPY